jgi:hypothetical protein
MRSHRRRKKIGVLLWGFFLRDAGALGHRSETTLVLIREFERQLTKAFAPL